MQRLVEWLGHSFWEIRGTRLTAYVGICKGWLNDQDISSEKSEALDSHAMLEHAKVGWVIRTSLLRNQRHWTHILCWNMQRLVEWSEHLFWEIRGTGLTAYVGTCKGWLSDQNISSEKSEALDSQAMLEHKKVGWVIRTSLLRNQRHWTHILYWNMQRLVEWSEHLFWEIKDTGLTYYVGTCKGWLSDQDISSEKSEALDSHTILEYAKVGWVIRTSLLRNQRYWTHILHWNMQRLVEWSGHLFWEIRGTGLTYYIGTCKGWLSDQNISSEKSKILDSHTMLEHAKVGWVIRTSLLRNQRHWTHMLCWNMQRLVEWSEHFFWEIRGTGLTSYVGTCKDQLSDQNIFFEKSEALDSHPMLEHAKINWVIRTSLLRNQRHWTHRLCWNMQGLVEWLGHLLQEIKGTGLTAYVGTCKSWLSDQDNFSEKSEALDSHSMLEHIKVVWVISTPFWKHRHWMNSQAILEDAKIVWVTLIRNAISIHIIKCTYLLNIL